MELLHAWVAKQFYGGKPPASDNYATSMLYALAGDYSAWIEEVPLDPGGWGAICTEAKADADLTPSEGLRAFIQFDRFEDGLALTLRTMFKAYGPRRAYIAD